MISIGTAIFAGLFIILIHWLADFHMQTHEMSMNKSKSNLWLTAHVSVYSVVTLLFWHLILFRPLTNYSFMDYFMFFSFIFSSHWITDYITSRMTSKRYAEGRYHDFFVVVGFDQFLHYVQLFTAYYIFIK